MQRLILLLLVLTLGPTPVVAHHKLGHHTPPGHVQKQGQVPVPANIIQLEVVAQSPSDEVVWRRYVDEEYGFKIDLPFGLFELGEEADRGLFLRAVSGQGELKVYGADNLQGRSPREFAAVLEESDRIEEVTYRAGGRSWFVLSGYYADDGYDDPIIFYTKFMFSPDRSRVAAFEISFPESEKPRFAPIVEHIENSLRAPL